MRSIHRAALIVTTLALAACGGEAPAPLPPPPPPPVASAAPVPPPADTTPPPPPKPTLADLIPQTLKGIGEAFNAHDAKKLASYHTEDCLVAGYGEPDAHGREEIEQRLQGFFDAFSDVRSAPLRFWVKGNAVVQEIAWSGTMTGDMKAGPMSIKASKKPAGGLRVHVAWFNDDGLVKEVHHYADNAGLLAQMQGKPGAPPVPTLPTNSPESHFSKGNPDEDKLVDWAKGATDTYNMDDAKAAAATMGDDGDYFVNISNKPAFKGQKETAKEWDNWFKTFPDQKWTASNIWGIDGFAIAESTMTGTQKGKLGPLPPSNKRFSNWHWITIVQPNADGKIQHAWAYANLVEMMMQTGAIKPPGEKAAAKTPPANTGAAAAPSASPAKK